MCGRLKRTISIPAGIVYNNFPGPRSPTTANTAPPSRPRLRGRCLDACARFLDATLADLYDLLTMPPALVRKAHQALDRAVDAAYIAAEKPPA